MLLQQLSSDALLERAFAWLCRQRRHYPAHADVWSLRQRWPEEKRRLQRELRAHTFRFDLLTRLERDGEAIELWAARDAVVLKALAWLLAGLLPISQSCTHVQGHGGAQATVRAVSGAAQHAGFVLRTDVRSYYASIDHGLLLDRLARYVRDRGVLNLVGQYLTRTAECGGHYFEHRRGISLGCPLSPLIGAFFLRELDAAFAGSGLFYRRFMDDVLILAPTRWKLRRAVQTLNRIFTALRVEKHPDKTYIGRVARGFEFLGYHISPQGLRVAAPTLLRFVERATRLYEQGRKSGDTASRLGKYVRRWLGWARLAGVQIDGAATLSAMAAGSGASSTTSLITIRPPGRSTRARSR